MMTTQNAYSRRKINLDTVFDNPLLNMTGEPITPTKIAIFYLLRKLFHAHFGVRAVPSLKPFDKQEKLKAFSIIYGLIFIETEISYDDFRCIVKILNDEVGRAIYYHFVTSMEKLAYGDEQIEMLFEDSFYTGKRPTHEMVLKRKNERSDDLLFMNSNSFMYIWIKRVLIQYTKTSQSGLFVIYENMREWISTGNITKLSSCSSGINMSIPFEIDCSVRARLWITKQLCFVQYCPNKSMDYEEILNWCNIIYQRHRDLLEVDLLRAIVHIQLKNQPDAVMCLKTFFDLSMLQMTECAKQALKSYKLMAPSQVALRFGPILQGRVYRIFGDRNQANSLFSESIQQSQLNNDDMCNRIANLELTINSVLMSGPILERQPGAEPKNEEQEKANEDGERRMLQNTTHTAADMHVPHARSLQKSFKEDFDLHTYLVSMSKFMLCIEDMMDGKFFKFNNTADYVSVGFHRLRLLYDQQNKGRVIEDFANAIMTSGLIQCGMYNQARRAAETMLVNNCISPSCPKFEMENQAVAGVNLVYSLAALGDYDAAFRTISNLQSMFPMKKNWMAARHVNICVHIVRFEKDFLLNRYSACYNHLRGLESTAPLEFTLRKSLLLAATGRLPDAVELLSKFNCEDVRGKMRISMQLATIHTGHGHFEKAEQHLEEAGQMAINTHFCDVNALVSRRIASVLLARQLPQEAFQILVSLTSKLENFGTYIEKAVLYVSIARCLRLLKKDPLIFLKMCKSHIDDNKWPAMEKLILTELAVLHNPKGLYPDENKATWAKERFGTIETDYPGPCSWLFI